MSPEYLEELANVADPLELWRLLPRQQQELSPEQKRQLDAGVALRRYAAHIRSLNLAYKLELSYLVTPLGTNSSSIATKSVPIPKEHRPLRR